MIGLDELDCLDYLIWLRTGDRVAKRLNMDQASVSRKARRAVTAFGLDVKKRPVNGTSRVISAC